MTEPTPESLSIAHRYASGVAECAREIDALAEKRVALAVAKCFRATGLRDGETWSRDALEAAKEIRNRMAEAVGRPAPVDDPCEQRVAAAVALAGGVVDAARKMCEEYNEPDAWIAASDLRQAVIAYDRADRPGPEGAAPTIPPLVLTEEQAAYLRELRERETNYDPETIIGRPDLARRRCSTPSQPDISEKQDSLRGVGVEQPTQDIGQPGCGAAALLLPCPFCGSASLHRIYDDAAWGRIMCFGCGAKGGGIRTERGSTDEWWVKAEALWNRRADPTTPSQEDTGSVSGTVWRPIEGAPKDGAVVWVYVASAHGLPDFQGSCAYHPDGGWCADELRPVTHWVPIECVYLPPPNAAGGPGSTSNTESSPTQTVAAEHDAKAFAAAEREISRLTHENADLRAAMRTAAAPPGPTAGDVERARSIIDDAANIVGGPEAGMLCKDIADALATERASARAELLAQIREPSEELFGLLKDKYWQFGRDELAEFMRALADKLTEAK